MLVWPVRTPRPAPNDDTANVGSGKTLTPAINFTSGSASNYAITFVTDTTGVINQRPITITRPDQHQDLRRYDFRRRGSDPDLDPGRFGRATRSETYDTKNAGSGKTLTPAITFTSGSASNYVITVVTNTNGTITARAITVTAATNTKAYDATTSSGAIPTITSGALAGTDTAASPRPFDTQTSDNGKTLTPAGLRHRRQRRGQLRGHLRQRQHRRDHGPGHHRHRRYRHQDLRRQHELGRHADDHLGQPGIGRHSDPTPDLRQQERRHRQDADPAVNGHDGNAAPTTRSPSSTTRPV